MQIVIELPQEVYAKNIKGLDAIDVLIIRDAIKNGTPLPKGHGRLIDADDKENLTICFDDRGVIKKIEAPTIIEADKAERSE